MLTNLDPTPDVEPFDYDTDDTASLPIPESVQKALREGFVPFQPVRSDFALAGATPPEPEPEADIEWICGCDEGLAAAHNDPNYAYVGPVPAHGDVDAIDHWRSSGHDLPDELVKGWPHATLELIDFDNGGTKEVWLDPEDAFAKGWRQGVAYGRNQAIAENLPEVDDSRCPFPVRAEHTRADGSTWVEEIAAQTPPPSPWDDTTRPAWADLPPTLEPWQMQKWAEWLDTLPLTYERKHDPDHDKYQLLNALVTIAKRETDHEVDPLATDALCEVFKQYWQKD